MEITNTRSEIKVYYKEWQMKLKKSVKKQKVGVE